MDQKTDRNHKSSQQICGNEFLLTNEQMNSPLAQQRIQLVSSDQKKQTPHDEEDTVKALMNVGSSTKCPVLEGKEVGRVRVLWCVNEIFSSLCLIIQVRFHSVVLFASVHHALTSLCLYTGYNHIHTGLPLITYMGLQLSSSQFFASCVAFSPDKALRNKLYFWMYRYILNRSSF